MSCVCLVAVPIDAVLLTIIPLFFFPTTPPFPFLRRTSVLPSLTPGQALQCYKCKVGFWNLCITTKDTCDNGEHCFSGVGQAGEESGCQKSHPATFCTVAISVHPHPAAAQSPATLIHFFLKKKKKIIISLTYLFFSLNDKCPLKRLSIRSAALFFSSLLFFSVDFSGSVCPRAQSICHHVRLWTFYLDQACVFKHLKHAGPLTWNQVTLACNPFHTAVVRNTTQTTSFFVLLLFGETIRKIGASISHIKAC